MNVTAFRSVRGRLLALMVLVIVPIAVITAVTAVATYRSVLASIETAQLQTVGNFAVRTRVWFRESLRSLLAASLAIAATREPGLECRATAARIVGNQIGISGLSLRIGEEPACSFGATAHLSEAAIASVVQAYRQSTRSGAWIGAELAETSYGVTELGRRKYLVVYARRAARPDTPAIEALLLADAELLDRAFELGTVGAGVVVGLFRPPAEVIITRGSSGPRWLPQDIHTGPQLQRWQSRDGTGATATYGAQLVAEPDLYVLARFDQQAERAAFLQFIALLLTPLVTLAVLFAVYSLAIDANIVRWIRGIEAAAVARASHQPKMAPVDRSMPDDIRRVSEAFNAMVAEQAERVERLNLTIGANRHLVRELHHRVKNSLQVVQSYLSLARRQHGEGHRLVLSAIEAKVHVLSIAYRHALSQGEMRPVELKPFLEEVTMMLNGLMRTSRSWIGTTAPDDAAIVVDRAIPLGLLVVEIATHALLEDHADHVAVTILPGEGAHLALEVETDHRRSDALNTRIAEGLLRQIGATRRDGPDGPSAGRWDIPA